MSPLTLPPPNFPALTIIEVSPFTLTLHLADIYKHILYKQMLTHVWLTNQKLYQFIQMHRNWQITHKTERHTCMMFTPPPSGIFYINPFKFLSYFELLPHDYYMSLIIHNIGKFLKAYSALCGCMFCHIHGNILFTYRLCLASNRINYN